MARLLTQLSRSGGSAPLSSALTPFSLLPSCKHSFAATVLRHCSLMGTWTSVLSAFNFQHRDPRIWVHPISSWFPNYHYHHPTPRDLVHITVPGACTFGIGAFSFWQPCYPPLFCSSVLFKVYCLPKMTSLRCGRWGERLQV